MRWNTFIFNRSALTLLVLAPPLLGLVSHPERRWRAAALAGILAFTVLYSESGAAALGLLVGSGAYLVARWSRRLALALAAAALVGAVASAPVAGELFARAIPPAAHARLAETNSQARVDIWRSFGAAVRQAPWTGSGFGPGAAFAVTPAAQRVDPSFRGLLSVGHTHNAALQIWAELGAVGALLGLLVLCLVLRALARLPEGRFAPRFALMAAVTAVAVVGHGAWQGWWAAAIGAAVVWFRAEASIEAARRGGRE
jgi:O-antigen ligase